MRFWKRRIPLLIILALLGIAAWQLRGRKSTPISAKGGEPFQNRVTVEIIDKPTHAGIDAALKGGYPVVAKLLLGGTIPHWVLIVGKTGTEYQIRDPLGDGGAPEPISQFDSEIFAIRIVKPAAPH